MTDSIWQRHRKLMLDRVQKSKSLMEEYDRDVYYPAMLALQKECEEGEGHGDGKYHDNGLGWHWFYCGKCGARYGIEKHAILED